MTDQVYRYCDLGDHYVANGARGRSVPLKEGGSDVRVGWACYVCIERLRIQAQTITEGPPLDAEGMEYPIID